MLDLRRLCDRNGVTLWLVLSWRCLGEQQKRVVQGQAHRVQATVSARWGLMQAQQQRPSWEGLLLGDGGTQLQWVCCCFQGLAGKWHVKWLRVLGAAWCSLS
jgi:hypothetical protein